MLNKDKIIRSLHEKDYIKQIHNKVVTGLTACLVDEYLGTFDTKTMAEARRLGEAPYLNTIVKMLASSILYFVTEKQVEMIIDIIEEEGK